MDTTYIYINNRSAGTSCLTRISLSRLALSQLLSGTANVTSIFVWIVIIPSVYLSIYLSEYLNIMIFVPKQQEDNCSSLINQSQFIERSVRFHLKCGSFGVNAIVPCSCGRHFTVFMIKPSPGHVVVPLFPLSHLRSHCEGVTLYIHFHVCHSEDLLAEVCSKH